MPRTDEAAAVSPPKSPGASPPAGRPRSNAIWLQGLACGALVTLAFPLALLLAVLLAPSAALLVLDARPGRPALRPMLLCAAAAGLRPVVTLWRGGDTLDLGLALALDFSVVATTWAAQAGGWLLAELAPEATRFILQARTAARAAALRARRARLEAEWNIPPLPGVDASAEAQADE